MPGFMKSIFGKNATSTDNSAATSETLRKSDLLAEPKGATTLRQDEAPSGPNSWTGKTVPVFQIGDVILDTYEVKDVKSGGMGNVYIVEDLKDKQMLAVKAPNQMMLSHPDFFARVLREADAWIDLGVHPHIAFCYFIQKIEDIPHIFIEYVDGGNLEEWISDLRCDDLKISLDMAIQFCHGMEHAHQHGLIHRDIKPKNILVTKEGLLKITDFGIARKDDEKVTGRAASPELWSKSLTSLGAMGTYDYMPPEQFEDPHGVDARADTFAFGVCLYEMICGRRPYDETSLEAKTKGISLWEPVKLREDIPAAVADLLKRCVALEKEDRYSSFIELRDELTRTYQALFQTTPLHATIEVTEMRADVLNNRGVSYWHLGKIAQARQCWEAALQFDQQHLEATVNLGHLRWDLLETGSGEYLTMLKELESKYSESNNFWRYLAWVYLEQGNIDEIKKIQQSAYQVTEPEFLRAINSSDHPVGRELRQFRGPFCGFNSISFSPDGRYVLSGNDDCIIRLWEVITGKEVRQFIGHTDIITSVSFSPDSRYALSGSKDETMRLWEVATGKNLRIFTRHTGWVNSVCFSPDGLYALSGSSDETIRLWKVATGKELRQFKVVAGKELQQITGKTDDFRTVSFSPNGHYILSGSFEGIIRLWEVATGKELRKFSHGRTVTSVSFSPDGRYALSGGSRDETILLWEVATGKELRKFKGHEYGINSVNFSPDGHYVLSGSNDRTIRLWEVATGKELRQFVEHTYHVIYICFSQNGRYALSGSHDNTIRLWEVYFPVNQLINWNPYLLSIKPLDKVTAEAAGFQKLMAQATAYYELKQYQQAYQILRQAQQVPGYTHVENLLNLLHLCKISSHGNRCSLINVWYSKSLKGHTGYVTSVSFSPDGRYALSGSHDRTIRLWEVATGKELQQLIGYTSIKSVSFSPDGRYILSGDDDKTICLWEVATGKVLQKFAGHKYGINSYSFSSDGQYALTGSEIDDIRYENDNTIKLWEVAIGKELRQFKSLQPVLGCNGGICSVCFSPDGQYAMSGGKREIIRLWEVATGKELQQFKGHSNINSIRFSPDGRYAMSGGKDQIIRLWEVVTGRELRQFIGHTSWVNSVSFSPDGRYALSGGGDDERRYANDTTIRLWEVATGKELWQFIGHTKSITSVSFSPDSRYALSGSHDKTIRLWEFDWEWEFPDEKAGQDENR